ncbi:MAG: hypothetical protein PHY16_03445 [Methylobacter sp.]|nr:hypothetical protein [Methylobacter sp.]
MIHNDCPQLLWIDLLKLNNQHDRQESSAYPLNHYSGGSGMIPYCIHPNAPGIVSATSMLVDVIFD